MLTWLLGDDQPSVQYRTLVELLGRSPTDPEVRAAKARIATVGWVPEILSERAPGGWWVGPKSYYTPKYLATNWKLIVLSDLGVTRALIRFGYADDRRVRRTLDWLVASADPKGGWSCWGSGRNLDSWEGLSALAAYPRARRSAAMERAIERGAEFFLERELHRQGERYAPWYRFHYPVHYYYDLLVGLELLTSLGYGSDPRLRYALEVLRRRRRADGRWNLDAVHPDVEGPPAAFYRTHPSQRPIPWSLEAPGQPSKIVTLTALKVLDRVGA